MRSQMDVLSSWKIDGALYSTVSSRSFPEFSSQA